MCLGKTLTVLSSHHGQNKNHYRGAHNLDNLTISISFGAAGFAVVETR